MVDTLRFLHTLQENNVAVKEYIQISQGNGATDSR